MPLVLALLAILALLAYVLSGTILMKMFMLFTGVIALACGVIGAKLWASWSEEGEKTGNDMAMAAMVPAVVSFCSWVWVIVCVSYFVWWS
jgi:hypothetical protein